MEIKNNLFVLVLSVGFLAACQPAHDKASQSTVTKKADSATKQVAADSVAKSELIAVKAPLDFRGFWSYYTSNIKLYEDFVAHNVDGKVMDKTTFLQQMKTEHYLPMLLTSSDSKPHYQLFRIPKGTDPNIGTYMRQFAADELKYDQMKGKPIPAFSFKDINGKLYTSANTKGKIVLFKCWFIGCVACVQEMPALNELVQQYKDRNDILFVSLAIDAKAELQAFLAKTKFDYATVPNQEHYMAEKLMVNAYPTHFLIDKNGLLVNVVSEEVAIASLLEREVAKN
ncbi:TlpA disulfide reductase family protein [Pedobacter sp. KR3-3]|uniref:TlpA disulfide reductase family protein n=1 Tax=Pedobacter albus TaxID=3113905 RepID=A0ABU7I6D1_9SPHI|nr:TlpA disulfide reductase family protein [Pedobacter sp. KR3-3]MEE1944917.1 TlpA disulfide reductase family protein [Pedobacter sp. KR3-3]